MKCSRCDAIATVERGNTFYCEPCSVRADWQELIVLIQDAKVETPVAGGGAVRSA